MQLDGGVEPQLVLALRRVAVEKRKSCGIAGMWNRGGCRRECQAGPPNGMQRDVAASPAADKVQCTLKMGYGQADPWPQKQIGPMTPRYKKRKEKIFIFEFILKTPFRFAFRGASFSPGPECRFVL